MLIHLNFKLTSAWTCYLKFWVSFLAAEYTLTFLTLLLFYPFYFIILPDFSRFAIAYRGEERGKKKPNQNQEKHKQKNQPPISFCYQLRKSREGKKMRSRNKKGTSARASTVIFRTGNCFCCSPKVVFYFPVGLKFISLKTSLLILVLFRVPDLPSFLSQPSW